MRAGIPRARESGFVLPSWVALASLAIVAVAGLAFFVTGPGDPNPAVSTAASEHSSRSHVPRDAGSEVPTKTGDKPSRHRAQQEHPDREPLSPQAYVEVYNNSTVSGLAAQTASELQDAGWNVVGTDNWYGSIPASTIYYPQRLREQAQLLARDLGVDRVLPAVSPMRFDRLTVILTAAA